MKKILSLIFAIAFTLSLVGCGNSSEGSATAGVEAIQERGYITAATCADYPPFEFVIIEDGKEKTVGLDISIAEEIAKDLGVELRLKELSFEGLLLELDLGNVDIVLAGMTPTEERAEAVDFSDIYYTSTQSIIVLKENVDLYESLDDFTGKKVGVQLTSVQETIAKEQIPDANITSLNKVTTIMMDLMSGNIDACIIETAVAEGYLSQYPELAICNIDIETDDIGSAVAIKKGNDDLVEAINESIERLKNENLIEDFIVEAIELAGEQ